MDRPTAALIEAAWGALPGECTLAGDEAAFSTAKAREMLGWSPEHSWHEAERGDVQHPQP